MRALTGPIRVALAVAVLLAALSFVTWRQSRTLEALAALDDVRHARALAEAERTDLRQRIQVLESRGHVVPAARERLGMHSPEASEIVLLPGDTP